MEVFWVPCFNVKTRKTTCQPVYAYSKKQAAFIFYKRQEKRYGSIRYCISRYW